MSTSPINPMSEVIQHLRTTFALPEDADRSDTQLLDAFVSSRDPAALETLVRRYASVVWGVCRRILRDQQDVEDAFQATFLVLVRKGAQGGLDPDQGQGRQLALWRRPPDGAESQGNPRQAARA